MKGLSSLPTEAFPSHKFIDVGRYVVHHAAIDGLYSLLGACPITFDPIGMHTGNWINKVICMDYCPMYITKVSNVIVRAPSIGVYYAAKAYMTVNKWQQCVGVTRIYQLNNADPTFSFI